MKEKKDLGIMKNLGKKENEKMVGVSKVEERF